MFPVVGEVGLLGVLDEVGFGVGLGVPSFGFRVGAGAEG